MRTTALRIAVTAALALLAAGPARAQLLPGVPQVGGVLGRVEPVVDDVVALPTRVAQRLEAARLDRVTALVRRHPGEIALDPDGFPARAHEVVVSDPDDTLIAAAAREGFRLIERADALGIGYARLETPHGLSLKSAIRALRRLGAREVSADQLHFVSGAVAQAPAADGAWPAAGTGPTIGMIDGGVAGGAAAQRGFASGAPRASDHGTAVASLIVGLGRVKGAAPGARLLAADVYGSDPAGGNATAIAQALAWLVNQGAPVVTMSFVGPANPLLGRVIAAAEARGTVIVAAVGNDGPASPYAYPASYPGVIAVTGVDGRKRVLIEAGRATHLDYSAPAADMVAASAGGGIAPVRGTSFAAPLVAATIARAYPQADSGDRAGAIAQVDAEAERLGSRYGRGLVCWSCRTPPN